MAATSIAAQLEGLKSRLKTDTDVPKRPITRPSVLYDPRQAADLDIDAIFNISLDGFDVLVNIDERFRNYKSDLFSHKSKELDRELLSNKENDRISASISSYLRLISGHLQSHSAFATLEYLVRRYKIHVYDIEELLLCCLPYHDTHAFVRIVQLIDFGNSQWKFLDGVKLSGAPPPRHVIVQQCTRDMGLLEVICTYATPLKKHQPSTPVISFCTAVVVEVLGTLENVDSDTVKRILPFLNSGLQFGGEGPSDFKAGTLMIVGLLANRASLSPKLVGSLIRSVAEMAQADTKSSAELEWVQLSIMALVNIVQLQSVGILSKKAVDSLKDINHLPKILLQLTTRFNIDHFLTVLIESLIDYSHSDSSCKAVLVSIVETVTVRGLIQGMVFRLLASCLRLSQSAELSELSESGKWAKQLLIILNTKYPDELRGAVNKFLQDKRVQLKGDQSVVESLSKILDANMESSVDFSDSKIWFALGHPKAEIRRAALSNLNLSAALTGGVSSSKLVSIQDAVVHCLSDEDLSVVKAALSLDKLTELIDFACLFESFQNLLRRCTNVMWSGESADLVLASDVAVSCLKHANSFLKDQTDIVEGIARMIFPLLLVSRKTKVVNLKAQELAKEIKWPLYGSLHKKNIKKKSGQEWLTMANLTTISSLADVYSSDPEKSFPWLVKCCGESDLSKTLVFLVLLQSFMTQNNSQILTSYEASFTFLKNEWKALEHAGGFLSEQNFDAKTLDVDNLDFLGGFDESNLKDLNVRILVFVFWRLMKAFISSMAEEHVGKGLLQKFFAFFAESVHFKEHRNYLVQNCKESPVQFLSSFIFEQGISSSVQVESLRSFTFLCSQADEGSALQLLSGFPLILVPLSSEIQDVRTAAMEYVEELSTLCSRVNNSGKKNGNSEPWSSFINELLSLVVQQKKFVLSDRNFLPSLLSSLLSASSVENFLVPQDVCQKFEKPATKRILTFIMGSTMKFPGYAKLKILSLLKELGGAIVHVKEVHSLMCELLQRRGGYHLRHEKSFEEMSSIEVDILCLLIEICTMPASPDVRVIEEHLLPALLVDGVLPNDPAIIRPWVTFLQKLNDNLYQSLRDEVQQNVLRQLVLLYHDANVDLQNATRDALVHLDISCSSVAHMLNSVSVPETNLVGSTQRKKKKSTKHSPGLIFGGGNGLSFLSSLLDILLLKKDLKNRALLIEPLFQLLGKAFSSDWTDAVSQEKWVQAASAVSQTMSDTLCYIQQTVLLILEDIVASIPNDSVPSNGVLDNLDAMLLVGCARSATDAVARNHVFSLFAAIAKIMPDKILDQIPEIIAIIGESTVSHTDSHSNRVFEHFISTVVPCWLSKMEGSDNLLQIFVNVMPRVAPHRRLTIVLHLLKTLGESSCLGSLLVLLFRSLTLKVKCSSLAEGVGNSDFKSSVVDSEWEYNFAVQICEQYTCMIWLPSLVSLLKQLLLDDPEYELFMTLLLSLNLIVEKLQDPELAFKIHSGEDTESIQGQLCELMVQVVSCWQLVDLSKKKTSEQFVLRKELKGLVHSVLLKITMRMLPSFFFKGIIFLLLQEDKGTRKKALQVLCDTVRNCDVVKSKRERRPILNLKISWHHLEGNDLDSLSSLCQEILHLLDDSHGDLNGSLRLAAISALEVLATKFPSNHTVFSKCLAPVVKNVMYDDLVVVSCCLRTTGTLVNVLGPRALPELPQIMKIVLKRNQDGSSLSLASTRPAKDDPSRPASKDSVMLSVLLTLEALVVNLGAFLNPYLGDIVELLVLHPDNLSECNQKLKSKADDVMRLLSEKVPLRLALPPIQSAYSKAVNSGASSLCAVFELLKNFIDKMDRSSVNTYYTKIFDLCMLALDLRRQHPTSVKNIDFVEKHVLDAMIALTMKITESMLKPLFIRSIEWAETNLEEDDSTGVKNIARAVSFYGFVNKLAGTHRSLFVPYFKYLVEGSIRYLTDDDEKSVGHSRKKKKAKLQKSLDGTPDAAGALSIEKWNLRALVLSSLHKCFLYDSGSMKFLDSSKFQLLLKPIVSQLAVDPPSKLEEYPDVPSVKEFDDILVSCLGQMAVAAASDLLWKPLNYEVLMQTRCEMVRTRLVALRIIKYLVENLKEEYLALLAETIPFLAELLEDVELPVKTLAQDILKELESMSGENLRQYF